MNAMLFHLGAASVGSRRSLDETPTRETRNLLRSVLLFPVHSIKEAHTRLPTRPSDTVAPRHPSRHPTRGSPAPPTSILTRRRPTAAPLCAACQFHLAPPPAPSRPGKREVTTRRRTKRHTRGHPRHRCQTGNSRPPLGPPSVQHVRSRCQILRPDEANGWKGHRRRAAVGGRAPPGRKPAGPGGRPGAVRLAGHARAAVGSPDWQAGPS